MTMKTDLQLKLQAYLDGELSPDETCAVAGWLAQDADARALLGELQNTKRALAGFEADIKLPEAREFYWSKIERAIGRLEPSQPVAAPTSWFAAWRRLLIPAGVLALLILGTVALWPRLGFGPDSANAEFALADANAFTFRNYNTGTTLVWLPYNAENEFAEMNSQDSIQ